MEATQLSELISRVEQGEAVQSIIKSMGLNEHQTLVDLQLNHRNAVKTAKQVAAGA